MLFKDKFISSPFPFPEHDTDPRLKLESSYNLQWMKAVYSRYVSDRTGYRSIDREKFDELRNYLHGQQSIEKYKTYFPSKEDKGEQAAKGFVNINHDIFSPAPKFAGYMRQSIKSMVKTPSVIAIDEKSGAEKEEQKWRTWFYATQGEWVNKFDSDISYKSERPSFIPSTQEELEMFSEINGFKAKAEIAYTMAIKYSDLLSKFDVTTDQMINDILALNIIACKDYTDLNDGKVKSKYIDPGRYVGMYSLNHGFDKSPYHGHFEDYTIQELKKLTTLEEGELKSIAQQYAGKFGNPEWNDRQYDAQYDNNKWSYDNFNIRVFEGEYLTVNHSPKVKYTNKRNEVRYIRNGEIDNKNTNGRSEMIDEKVKCWYRCKWIVGTEHVFDYGMQYDTPRPSKENPRASYHVHKIPGKSFIETVRVSLDQIQIAHIKMENALAKAPPDGLAIDYGSLENINMGKGNMKPIDLLKIRRTQGDLIYKGSTHRGQYGGSAAKPVMPLPGGAGKMLEEAILVMERHFHYIAELSGIDRNSIGMTPSPETSATASQNAARGSSMILIDMVNGFNNVIESKALNVVHRTALRVKYSKEAYDIYHTALGNNTEILKISADMTPDQMGIEMKVVPDDQAVRDIHEAAIQAMNNKGESGAPGIELPDYLFVKRLLTEGQLDYAQAMLAYKISKSKIEWERSKAAFADNQNEGLRRIEEEKNTGKEATDNRKMKLELDKIKAQLDADIKRISHEQKEIRQTKRLELKIIGQQKIVENAQNQPEQEQVAAVA